jgi:hypothetical protein
MNQESETLEFFGPLLADSSKIKREAVRRRKQFDERSIAAEQIPEYEAEGWQVDVRLKRSIRVKRPKAIDERLENRFWMLLARLGYPEINAGRKFTMLIDRKGAEPLRKQVDVFAKDDETVMPFEHREELHRNESFSLLGVLCCASGSDTVSPLLPKASTARRYEFTRATRSNHVPKGWPNVKRLPDNIHREMFDLIPPCARLPVS